MKWIRGSKGELEDQSKYYKGYSRSNRIFGLNPKITSLINKNYTLEKSKLQASILF